MSAMMACDRTIRPPPPRPCTPRQNTNSQKARPESAPKISPENPAPMDPITKMLIAPRNNARRPSRSPNLPYSGMVMHTARM